MSKRANGEGTVYQRADGRWCAQVTVVGARGERVRKTVYAATQGAVVRKKRDIERARDRGAVQTAGRPQMLREYGDHWICEVLQARVHLGQLSAVTRDSYASNWQKHIDPHLGWVRLDALTPAMVRNWLADKRVETSARGRPLSPRSVQLLHAILRKALNDAVADELIARNVADHVRAPRTERPHIQPLTLSEAQAVLQGSAGDELHVLWLTLLALGLRVGEALALTWNDIDPDTETIFVRRSVRRVRSGFDPVTKRHLTTLQVREGTKTARGSARLPLPRFLIDALEDHRVAQTTVRSGATLWVDNDLIFPTGVGSHRDPRNVLRAWKETCRRSGIARNVRVHDLRHTTASVLHAKGVPMLNISQTLRHGRASTTQDLYTHTFEESRRAVATTMDALLRDIAPV